MAFGAFVALMLMGTTAGMIYVDHQFAEINDISTPPPKVSGGAFDDAATAEVDTSPARQVVATAESGETGEFNLNKHGNVAPATPSTRLADADAPVQSDRTVDHIDESSIRVTSPVAANNPAPEASFTLKPVNASPAGSLNILLMGVDARPGEAIDVGVRPDSLSVLHLDGETGACRILGIPRDTRTELPGYGQTKVNHALAVGGIPYEMLVVEQLLGIEIDHYGLINFAGIEELVDAVGGVTVVNDEAFTHLGFTFDAGSITLNGEEGLAYARYRYGNDGDFGRIRRQQQIMRSVLSQTSSMDVVQGANELLGAVDGHVRTDLSPTDLIGLANDFRSTCTDATLEVENLEGSVATFSDPLLHMDLSYVIVDSLEIQRKVAWLL